LGGGRKTLTLTRPREGTSTSKRVFDEKVGKERCMMGGRKGKHPLRREGERANQTLERASVLLRGRKETREGEKLEITQPVVSHRGTGRFS